MVAKGWNGPEITMDALVIGGGMAGLTLAIALRSAGLSVAVVERDAPERMRAAEFDGRVSAISAGSRRAFETLGLWRAMASAAAPVFDIRVTDNHSPAFVHFDHGELDQGPLGHIVENRVIRAALFDAAGEAGVEFIAPASVAVIGRDARRAVVELSDGRRLAAPLVVGADGRASLVRAEARINQTEWRYSQGAIVTIVVHERPHRGIAEERFLPSGPFAILPMTDDGRATHRSSVVWTERETLVDALLALGRADFDAELAARFGGHLGGIAAVGPRWSYPLGLSLAEAYVADRVALIGDAAHGIHPIAGQGLNLGIRDAAALAEVIVDARRLGLDYGMTTVLADYERWRRFDNVCLAGATDVLNRLFSTGFAPLALARRAGLAAVNRLGPARRFFMREAMGIAGDLPRLIRGEAL